MNLLLSTGIQSKPLNHQRLSYVIIATDLKSVPKTIEPKLGPISKKFIAFITSLKMQ